MNGKDINIDQEFWNDFILEAFEHIEEIETNVLTLEKNPEDMDIIHTMFRAFHTIKGLSGFVEHSIIQEIAHKTETLMDMCRKGEMKVNTDIVNAILKSSDYVKKLCEDMESCRDDSFIGLIEKHIAVVETLANKETKTAEPKAEVPVKVEEVVAEEAVVQDADKFMEDFADFEKKSEEDEAEEVVEKAKLEESKSKKKTVSKEEPKEEPIQEKPVIDVEALKAKFAASAPKEEPPAPEPPKTEQPKAEETKTDESKKTFAAPEEHMKVANSKIDHLVDMIGELIINQALIEQYISDNYSHDNQLSTNMSGFLRITRELQSLSMSLRMVSLRQTFQKITRIARDTIQELGKDVEFVTSGDSTEIDRVVTDKLLDPLVHMIKNAISHGVEKTPEDRVANKKPRRAKVELNAYSKRGKIFIEVKDDGRGINTEVVYKKALEKGIIDPNVSYSEAEIKEFIMLPGFSTAEKVDNISGRGVGMDVVKTQILKIGGKVDIKSELNEGSTFTLEVPVNHAIMNGTVIEVKGEQFIVPTINVKEFLQPTKEQWIFTQQKRTMLRVRENIIPIISHSLYFKENGTQNADSSLVMLLELDQELKALPIDNVINRQEVVVKPVGEEFANLKFISGMSILGNGKVSLILDIDYLFKKEVKD